MVGGRVIFKSLTKDLGGFKIDSITEVISEGLCYAFLGGTGSGKSLIIKMAAGLMLPDSGSVVLEIPARDGWTVVSITPSGLNFSAGGRSESVYEGEYWRNVAYISQKGALISNMSVIDNVLLPVRYHGIVLDVNLKKFLADFGIAHLIDRMPPALTVGEKKLVALARTYLLSPKILFFDEPFESVDVIYESKIKSVLNEFKKRGTTLVITTNSPVHLKGFVDRIGVILFGRMIVSGTYDELSTSMDPVVRTLFESYEEYEEEETLG